MKCEAVTLYGGGQYWLYQYRRYDDVRLVFAPEDDIAAFGGDPDNFQFPRWCLDFSLLRAYENGAPAATPQHLTIDFDGPRGRRARVRRRAPGLDRPAADGRRAQDAARPQFCRRRCCARRSCAAATFSSRRRASEPSRIVQDSLFGLENSIKVQRKQLDALLDDALLAAKHDAEADLRARVEPQSRAGRRDRRPVAEDRGRR